MDNYSNIFNASLFFVDFDWQAGRMNGRMGDDLA